MIRRSFISVLCLFIIYSSVSADIPKMISYQGKVTDSAGDPVTDGMYNMRFRIYNAPTGGSELWNSGLQTVSVTGGIFNVLLGESPMPTLDLPFDEDYWLLVTFDGINQTPRQRLVSVSYAHMASGLVPGTEVIGSVTSGTAAAIKATNTATSGTIFGVYGESSSTDASYGVYGRSSSTWGLGLYGFASSTSGLTYGAYGRSNSTQGRGVYGLAFATSGITYGVYGRSNSSNGIGVYGYASTTLGTNYGVWGETASWDGKGVYGYATLTSGNGQGVRGVSESSDNGVGVYGLGSSTTGLNYGVFGRSQSTDGYGVYYAGGLAGSGTKSCVVKTSRGPTLMYCQESPENWFEDVGRGELINGRARVELDPLFLETVTIDKKHPMNVFVQLRGDCRGVFVEEGLTGFDVIEIQGGKSSVSFAYRVMAKRKGFESKRLDYCKAAETDSYLYPELREKELKELEAERIGDELITSGASSLSQ